MKVDESDVPHFNMASWCKVFLYDQFITTLRSVCVIYLVFITLISNIQLVKIHSNFYRFITNSRPSVQPTGILK